MSWVLGVGCWVMGVGVSCRCLLWVVRIMPCRCSDGTFETKGWHFTPLNPYRNESKVPCLALEGSLSSTRRKASVDPKMMTKEMRYTSLY